MSPRPPHKPGVDPMTGQKLPSHKNARPQAAAHGPQNHTKPQAFTGPSILDIHEEAEEIEEAMILEDHAEDPHTLQEFITVIDPDSSMVLTPSRQKMYRLLEKINQAPSEGITKAVQTWRSVISDALEMPEIAPALYAEIRKVTSGLKAKEAELAPSDRVALTMFIDMAVKNLPGTPTENPQKNDEEITHYKEAGKLLKHTQNLKEAITLAEQLLAEAKSNEAKKGINKAMVDRLAEITIATKTPEDWSAWTNNLLLLLPAFKERGILTEEGAMKIFEKIVGPAIQNIQKSISIITGMKWAKEIKEKLSAASEKGVIDPKTAEQAIKFITGMQQDLARK